jgi:hypothetical protein
LIVTINFSFLSSLQDMEAPGSGEREILPENTEKTVFGTVFMCIP